MNLKFFLPVFIWGILLVIPVFAVLPPDAGARPQQIRTEYMRREKIYEKRQAERQDQAVRAYEQTKTDIFTPPWLRGAQQTGALDGSGASSAGETGQPVKRNNRLLISIVLLILIGSAVGWVHYSTRKQEE